FTFRNRILHAAMSTRYVENGQVPQALIDYHRSRAIGGAAAIVTEPMNVASHQKNPRKVDVYNRKAMAGLRALADAVAEQGAHLLGQIQDPGRGRHEPGRNASAIGASPLPDGISWTVPHALSTKEVERLISDFAESALILKEAGFSGVEMSCGHGHIFHQFASPISNIREDEFGGSREGRTLLIRRTIDAIRAACGPAFIIGVKLPGEDGVAIDMAEAAAIAALVAPHKPDYATFCWGTHADTLNWHLPDLHGPRVPFLEKIRTLGDQMPGIPLGQLGLITDPNEGERVISEGLGDLVMVGRPMITDPAWAKKSFEGREREMRYCVSCNTCWHIIIQGGRLQCDNNPRVGARDEADWWPAKVKSPKKIVVVGAGIAGLEAAWLAAARGHDVTVFGKSAEGGGKTRLHALLPGGENLSSIYDFQLQMGQKFGLKLEMGVEADLARITALKPDAVVLATGSTMTWPDFIPEDYRDPTFFPDLREVSRDLVAKTAHQGGTAVIFDMDHTAMTYAAAEMLKKRYDEVVLVTPRERLATDEPLVNRQGIYQRLFPKGIKVILNSIPAGVDGIEDGNITIKHVISGETQIIENVTLLTYSTPRRPNDQMAEPLRKLGIPVHVIGDAYAPRFVVNATADGGRVGNLV
ncbi:MAG: FAD-dependent oxidoreductase, partial [Rhodospirillaceae bacterium]|nr:FAD-dependent oxidoreductase [Rhodospirillaceae bacterium]